MKGAFMSSVAARRSGGESLDLGGRLKGAVVGVLTTAVAVFGLGVVLYYTSNEGLVPYVENLNELANVWAGMLVVLGLYAAVLVLKAAWVTRTVDLNINAALDFVVEVGVVLLLALVVSEFLV
jgi:hypothetical protein